jgi:potassium-dependent mechanosensitive channel
MLLITMAAIGALIKDNWPKPLFAFWRVLFVLTLIFGISNIMILITYADRVILLLVSAVAIYAAFKLIKDVKVSPDAYPPYLEIIAKIFIALQGISILLNVLGRFSLAKIAGTTAAFNLCLGMGLYLLVQILMESLFLQLEANKTADDQSITSYLDFKVLQKKFKDVVIKASVILWLVTLTQNLCIDDYIYDQANDFLNHPYKFSSTAFTFGSVLIFIVVIWISGLIARVISYFYDFAGQQQTKLTPQAKKTRSSILLIRLTVFVVGFFVAITAAGIPMDRVTIIIGALGVGIGFGLQNIVNNLVSGVILAFEKPVQVGDIIEVNGKSGTIKEIGIRSSKIACGNGSELIVPNGDLISQHVVNWTLSDNNRQVELVVGVAYGTDIAKVDALLKNILNNSNEVMKTPAPNVVLHNFSDSAVDFKLSFWAADIGTWTQLKSNVMSEIYTEFTKQGIEIPHPKRDIQVYFPEGVIPTDITKIPYPTKNPPEKDQ